MKLWFVTIGEPVPVQAGFKERLHRAGMMATAFADAGHDVVWWTSGFDHFKKKHIVQSDSELCIKPNFRIRILQAPGYKKNISLARVYDHYQIRRRFVRWAQAGGERPDAIISSLPTVGLCKASVNLGRAWGIPTVVDVRDLWPDIYPEFFPTLLRPVLRLASTPLVRDCQRVCREATAIMGTTEEFVQWGVTRAGRERNEFDMALPFVYPENQFCPNELEEAKAFWDAWGINEGQERKTVAFTGSLGRNFILDAVIRCAHRMTKKDPTLRFALCGTGENLQRYRTLACNNPAIVLPGWIDAVKISALLKRTSLGFNPMPNRFDFLANINNKAVEYLASGVPMVSTPHEGVLARLIQQTGTGESTREGDDVALESLLTRLLGNPEGLRTMKANAQRLYNEQFSPGVVYRNLINHISAMVREHARPI